MADDLMLEVTGSSQKAVTALDKVIVKVSDLQAVFDKMSPSLKKFTTELASIADSSKGIAALKQVTEGTNRHALSLKDAESRAAMYQARLERANVSMERSRVASLKLAEAQKKLKEAAEFDAANKSFLENFKYKGFSNEPSKFYNPTAPDLGEPDIPTPPPGSSRLASQIHETTKAASVNVDTSQVMNAVAHTRSFIDSLTPEISKMSEMAQNEFNAIADELMRVSSQIDNQRKLYSQLASEATKAANANGEGSKKYLQLEKRMLSADAAIDKLISKQEKLKTSLSNLTQTGSVDGYANSVGRATSQISLFGNEAKKASSKSASGFQKTLVMMEKMFIRIAAFRIYSAVSKGLVEGLQNIAQASSSANKSLSDLSTSSLYLKNSIASALMPVIQALTPIITQAVDALAGLFNMIAMLTARIFNQSSTVTIAQRASVNYAKTLDKTGNSAKNTEKKVKELQRTIMGFDELNVLNKSLADSGSTPKSSDSGMPSYGSMFKTVQIPPWVERVGETTDKIKVMIEQNINSIKRLLRMAPLVIGAILAFSGANVPLGIGLMAIGAIEMAKQVKEDWGYLSSQTNSSLDKVKRCLAIAGAVELALGAILAFSGANVPLGIGLMIGGIATTAASLNWDSMGNQVKESIAAISFATGEAMLALGAILTFSGANVPLGIGLMLGGATTIASAVATNWGTMSNQLKSTLTNISVALGAFLLPLGLILALSGVGVPLGIALIAIGAANLAAAAALNWGTVNSKIKTVLSEIMAIASVSSVAMGLILCLSGAGIPLGIGLIMAGMKGVSAASQISTNPITKWAKDLINGVIGIFETGVNYIISMLNKVSFTVPDWVPGIGGKPYGISIKPVHIHRLATGGLITAPTYSLIGEGKDHEAVIPLNDRVFSQLAKGIVNNGGDGLALDEEVLYRAFSRALQEMPAPDVFVKTYMDSKEISSVVQKEVKRKDYRLSPVSS